MTAHADYLRRLCDDALIDGLPAPLKAAIDSALAAGCGRAEILRRVRAESRRRTGRARGLSALAVESYLESVAGR